MGKFVAIESFPLSERNVHSMDWGLALSTTATGMIVVFSVLVILIVVVWTMGKIMDLFVNRPKKKKKKEAEPAPVVTEEPTAVVAVETEDGISEEVVAAISAAVSVIMSAEGKAYRIRSVKRTKESRPAWSAAGIQENTRPF